MPANVDGMVREGINAYRAGRKEEARALLMRAVELDQYNEMGWMWLSAVVDTPEEQRTCLENALVINPNNENAKKGLDVLAKKIASNRTAPPPQQADDILAGMSFNTPKTAPPAAAPPPPAEEEEMPANIDWGGGIATSSASSRQRVDEPSSADYDDWVKDLNLGNRSNAAQIEAAQNFISNTFDPDTDDEDDLFGIGKAVAAQSTPQLDDDFESGPFSSPQLNDIDDLIGEIRRPPKASQPSPPAKKQPVSPPSPKYAEPDVSAANRLLDSIEEEDDDDEFLGDDDQEGYEQEDYDQAELDRLEPAEFFSYIPKEITATRVPGTSERYPALVILGLLFVIGLNIAGIALLVTGLSA